MSRQLTPRLPVFANGGQTRFEIVGGAIHATRRTQREGGPLAQTTRLDRAALEPAEPIAAPPLIEYQATPMQPAPLFDNTTGIGRFARYDETNERSEGPGSLPHDPTDNWADAPGRSEPEALVVSVQTTKDGEIVHFPAIEVVRRQHDQTKPRLTLAFAAGDETAVAFKSSGLSFFLRDWSSAPEKFGLPADRARQIVVAGDAVGSVEDNRLLPAQWPFINPLFAIARTEQGWRAAWMVRNGIQVVETDPDFDDDVLHDGKAHQILSDVLISNPNGVRLTFSRGGRFLVLELNVPDWRAVDVKVWDLGSPWQNLIKAETTDESELTRIACRAISELGIVSDESAQAVRHRCGVFRAMHGSAALMSGVLGRFGGALEGLLAGHTPGPVIGFLPDDHCSPSGVSGQIIGKDRMYFEFRAHQLFLANNRLLWTTHDPVAVVAVGFIYNGEAITIPRIVGPSLIATVGGPNGAPGEAIHGTIPGRTRWWPAPIRIAAATSMSQFGSMPRSVITKRVHCCARPNGSQRRSLGRVVSPLSRGRQRPSFRRSNWYSGSRLCAIWPGQGSQLARGLCRSGVAMSQSWCRPARRSIRSEFKATGCATIRVKVLGHGMDPTSCCLGSTAWNRAAMRVSRHFFGSATAQFELWQMAKESWQRAKACLITAYQEMSVSPDVTQVEAGRLFDEWLETMKSERGKDQHRPQPRASTAETAGTLHRRGCAGSCACPDQQSRPRDRCSVGMSPNRSENGKGGDMDYPYDLGPYARTLTTMSADAQRWRQARA